MPAINPDDLNTEFSTEKIKYTGKPKSKYSVGDLWMHLEGCDISLMDKLPTKQRYLITTLAMYGECEEKPSDEALEVLRKMRESKKHQ